MLRGPRYASASCGLIRAFAEPCGGCSRTLRGRTIAAFREIFDEAIRLGGTITGEHGIGVAKKEFLPMQPGDVPSTTADIEALKRDCGFAPSTPIEVGVPRFVQWYKEYHGV